MTYDPHTDWGPRWVDSTDLHGRICRLEAELAATRAERDALAAEVERMTTALCHAAIHECRDARIGAPSVWRGVIGA